MSGINLKSKAFLESLRLFEEDRKIDQEFIFDVLKEAITKTYQKHIDAPEAQVRVDISPKEMKIYHILDVVDDDSDTFDETLDILLTDAKAINPDAKIGDKIEMEVDFSEIGRSSVNVAKQMLKQKIKEFEKQRVYDEYKDKEFELISGIVKTVEEKYVLVDIKNTIGFLSKSEQIPGEVYREGQSIKCIIKAVDRNTKGSQVTLSRADAIFVKRLFEKEVPEIQQGIVEIKAIAREAGERTKMAVYSRVDDVDPIGACIGPRGQRVQQVIMEVKGEKVDVFEWNDNIGELVRNALSPAEVKACFYANELTDPELTKEVIEKYAARNSRPLVVVVDDDKLSVAIGKKGKNAKLAVKLTNRKIDIKTVSAVEQLGIDINQAVEEFKADQERIAKELEQKKFLATQEEALRRSQEFKASIADEDTGYAEKAFDEDDDSDLVETTIVDLQNEEERVDEDTKEETEEKVEEPVKEEIKEEVKVEEKPKKVKKPLTPKTDYVSKFEEFAGTGKKEENTPAKKRKKKDDVERRVRAEDLEKKEYTDDVKPFYSQEELDEIEALEQEEEDRSWINDDDIDFDEYEEYYDEEN